MKHLCGCFETQSLSWSVIQSVLNHLYFLIADCGHGSFLGDILAQQTVEILIAATLPAGKWSGKVGGALKLCINMCMRCKLFAVVKGQRLDPNSHRFELAISQDTRSTRIAIGKLTIFHRLCTLL